VHEFFSISSHVNLTVAKKQSKREMCVLGRQTIKNEFYLPGRIPPIGGNSQNLYSGTFSR